MLFVEVTKLLGGPLESCSYSSAVGNDTYAFGTCPNATAGNDGIALIEFDKEKRVVLKLMDTDCIRAELQMQTNGWTNGVGP